ncbi:response regulator [Rhodopseudomonas sp. HC1]|uniref:ATP-binding protein n=1 Tax=Rhodopseudomonas infernalis TaxID=2897386 RepID=UPI001EE94810|nr:ATP-binding protein [Rhodopseudomonas infernalis]MCG6204495.1 response regulator [Rhodopseudomonas infernalis]
MADLKLPVVSPGDESAGLDHLFLGGGELTTLSREFDWPSTSLGAPEQWPQALKTAVRIMLTSQQPIWIGWGSDLIFFYNDAYKAIIGGKHPWALGLPTREVWHEIWDDIAPLLAKATSGHEGTYVEAQLLIMERNGFPEETYYTFSYSPIPTEDGSPGGIFCANTDDTQRVISERQLSLLREVASNAAQSRNVAQACESSAAALASNPRDLPFALIYLVEPGGETARLAASAGIDANHPGVKPILSVAPGAESWPVADAMVSGTPQLVDDLQARFGFEFPTGGWRSPPTRAIVLPIQSSGDTGHSGFLVAGLNPFRLYDVGYRDFLALVAGQIAAAITNADAYEEERRRAEALAEIDRAKTAFFSNVSHEFRTPLTLMLSPLEEVITQTGLSDDQQALLGIAHRNGLRLLKLVNTLLDFARIEAGRLTAHFRPVDLPAFTAELASNFRSAMDKAGLRLVIDAPPLPQPVYVDRDMWEKVVLNLLSNAFKFTFEGEVAVSVGASPDGRSAEIVVRDTGTGIPPEEIPYLFERFRRVEGARGRSIEGSGIGLALVQELVKLHSGSIRVESEIGRGSAFHVTLPFGTAHVPAGRPQPVSHQVSTNIRAQAYLDEAMGWLEGDGGAADLPHASSAEDLGLGIRRDEVRPRVLLADDNPDMRDYVVRLLGDSYEVEAVGDGVAALEAAWKHRPDLVLSDIMMPRLDGLNLLKALRNDPRLSDVPVIFLSARAGEEAKVEGLEAGADDYLSKPFSARELLARVRSNLDTAEVRREALRTEHTLRQEAQAARDRAESILASISDGFVAIDSEYRFTYVNTAAERMMRRRASQLIGKICQEVYPALTGSRIEVALRRAMDERAGSEFEIEHGPSRRWFNLRVAPTNSSSVSVYFRDITERKRAETAMRNLNEQLEEQVAARTAELRQKEARLRTIFAASYTYQALLGVDGVLIDANLTSLSGIGAALDDVVGKPVWDTPWFAGTPGMTEMIKEAVSAVAAGGTVRRELHLNLPVGGWRWFDFQMRPVHDAQGQVIAIVPEAVEITVRRKAEEAFRQAQKMEAIGQLTGGVAHDFNNLLTVIRSSADLLRRRELPPDRMRRYVDAISDTADRAAKLTGQLLTFARRHAQNRQVFDVTAQIEQIAEMLRTALGSRAGFTLTIDERPLAIEADANQFDAALVNLVANARDAMDGQGELQIRVVRARPTYQEDAAGIGDVVAVSITDTGSGIAPDQIDRIFEPFFTTKDVGRGTGLGLSQVYGFVKQSGGHVSVDSELGKGTTITLRLPLSDKPIEQRERTAPGDSDKSEERKRVLVVEDNAEVGEFSTQLLHDLGYETVLASSAEQALQLLGQDAARFNIVLSDVVMPGMDGVALGREIRTRWPNLPIVLNSGYANVLADDGHHGFELLHKPYSVEDLSKVLRRALAMSASALG